MRTGLCKFYGEANAVECGDCAAVRCMILIFG